MSKYCNIFDRTLNTFSFSLLFFIIIAMEVAKWIVIAINDIVKAELNLVFITFNFKMYCFEIFCFSNSISIHKICFLFEYKLYLKKVLAQKRTIVLKLAEDTSVTEKIIETPKNIVTVARRKLNFITRNLMHFIDVFASGNISIPQKKRHQITAM